MDRTKRLQRSVALEGIRDQFNPFQYKTNARGPKFEATTIAGSKSQAGTRLGRPGLSKAAGEEKRRRTLLAEMRQRNKVGGIRDRRFGEEDPTMTAEEKMLQRFAREKQSSHKKASVFDLEDEGPEEPLTHIGKVLALGDDGQDLVDDFDEADLLSENESGASQDERRQLRRSVQTLALDELHGDADEEAPERRKSRQEVMKEVIAKSKLHKHERQAQKEADDDLRMEIDKELPQLQALLAREKTDQVNKADTAVAPRIAGQDKTQFEQAYDLRVKQLAQEKRAQATEPTKTEEEVAELAAQRLKELEQQRVQRMAGQAESGSEADDDELTGGVNTGPNGADDAAEFGLGNGIISRSFDMPHFDDEDDFIIDDDLVASESEVEEADDDEDSESNYENGDGDDPDEDEFTKGLLTGPEEQSGVFQNAGGDVPTGNDGLPYTFLCPQSHPELLTILDDIPLSKLPQVIQRIRALYHPSLAPENKTKLATFAQVLVQHIAHLGNTIDASAEASGALESLMRHVHSLAKGFPLEVSKEFRTQLEAINKTRPLALTFSDLAVLTAVRLYPTSDHFHPVVTPAMLTIARFLGTKVPQELSDYAVGVYLSVLVIDYQRLSKRYMPELLNFSLNTLCSLAPRKPSQERLAFPIHESTGLTRISSAQKLPVRRLTFGDCQGNADASEEGSLVAKLALASTTVAVLTAAADLWSGMPAFHESFEPVVPVLEHLVSEPCRNHLPPALRDTVQRAIAKLQRMLAAARLARRPLELHHHRPMAIKTFIPKFEDAFAPGKHYDADRDRAQLAKLRAEHRRERKGAIRELRKDAAFVARENLRQKKERDAAYEKKYKRLVAEIQGEEGQGTNEYEREKKARKRAKRR